jgi:hypothetical protein
LGGMTKIIPDDDVSQIGMKWSSLLIEIFYEHGKAS